MKTKSLSGLDVCGVLCISLKERADRRELLLKELEGTGLNIEFVLVDRDIENPERGCFYSHQKCVSIAKDRNYKRVLILEDDVKLMKVTTGQLKNINCFLADNNYELFYLGATLGKVWLTWSCNIARVRAQGAFAYIVPSQSYDKLLSFSFTGRGIDNIYSKNFKGYISFPLIARCQPEFLGKSDLASARNGDTADDAFWESNYKKSYVEVLKNLPKTVFRINL